MTIPHAFVVQDGPPQPCEVCGVPTCIIERETGRRRHIFLAGVFGCDRPETLRHHPQLGAPQPVRPPAPRQAPATSRRYGQTAPTPGPVSLFANADQHDAYLRRVAVLDAMNPADDSDETINRAAGALRIVEAMTDDPGKDPKKNGPFAPVKHGTSAPFWKAKLPPIPAPLVAYAGWGTFTASTDYTGPVTLLDRNAGHPSALSSLRVAHGPLQHTGELPDAKRPGYYKTLVYPWTRTDLPHPLAGREPGTEVWVTAERMRLIEELAKLGADWWPRATILDSWTAEKECPLRDLSQLIKHLRVHVIDTYGKTRPDGEETVQWQAVKEATNTKLLQIMTGTALEAGAAPDWTARKWYTKCQRTDWAHALHDKAAANLYRVAMKLVRADIPVLSMEHMDAMTIPAGQLGHAVGRELLRIDETGRTFGTFKTTTES